MLGLGLDAGGSASRWALSDGTGAILAAGEVAPITGHLYGEAERRQMREAAAAISAALPHRPASVVAGITGLSATGPTAPEAASILAGALGLPAEAVKIEEDIWIACHAAFAPGTGHVVYAGTGSIGAHLRADGTMLRVGGRGMLIDDGGSAFWIGREAVNAVWRARDTDPGFASPLARALDAAIGGSDWDSTRAHVYGGGRNAVAQLARAVAEAADEDADAHALLTRAGRELARLAEALVTLAGIKPVALLGRAAMLHPAIESGFRAASPKLELRVFQPDAAAAAARLAAGAIAAQGSAPTIRTGPAEEHK